MVFRYMFTALVLALITCLNVEHQIEAFDATEPLMRFQRPYFEHSQSAAFSRGSGQDVDSDTETLADVLLLPLLDIEDIPAGNVTKTCNSTLHRLAVQGGNFTHCMISHARPFRMCEECVTHYTRFTRLYESLKNDRRCYIALLLADHMHVMDSIYKMFTATWSDAYCESCFDSVDENTTTEKVTFNFTADTIVFREMQTNVSRCFHKYSHRFDEHDGNSSEVCHACKNIYMVMNNNFSKLKKENGGQVCMDLFDMMNYTRLMWSSRFNCHLRPVDASVVITISVCVAITTIILYSTSMYITKIRMPHIFKPKRLKTRTPTYGSMAHTPVGTSVPDTSASPFSVQ